MCSVYYDFHSVCLTPYWALKYFFFFGGGSFARYIIYFSFSSIDTCIDKHKFFALIHCAWKWWRSRKPQAIKLDYHLSLPVLLPHILSKTWKEFPWKTTLSTAFHFYSPLNFMHCNWPREIQSLCCLFYTRENGINFFRNEKKQTNPKPCIILTSSP